MITRPPSVFAIAAKTAPRSEGPTDSGNQCRSGPIPWAIRIKGPTTVQELSAALARNGSRKLRRLHFECADITGGEAGFSALIGVDRAAFGWDRVNSWAARKQAMGQGRTAIICQWAKHRVA